MRKLFFASALVATAFVGTAHAGVQYDQNVTGGVIYGSGNSNGGFTTDRESGIELGLRAHVRYPTPMDDAANIMSQGNGVYGNFAAGNFGPGGVRASWNFDFSINSNYDSTGVSIGSLFYQLQIDYDPSGGTSFFTFDPYTAIPDNATSGDLAQNSENLAFFPGVPAFNPAVSGVYDIILSAYRSSTDNTPIASTHIQVLVGDAVATPEAASIAVWSGFAACAMAVGFWRKKRAVKA